MTNFAFLAPWKNELCQFLEFTDEEASDVCTLHSRLRCLSVRLQYLDEKLTGNILHHLVHLREAVELIGLALHYDKRAWAWFQSFEYDVDILEPLFEFVFHSPDKIDDRERDMQHGIWILTGAGNPSSAYQVAKRRLRELVGDRFDDQYRVPVSFVVAPNPTTMSSVREWRESLCQFARIVGAPAYRTTFPFEFVDMKLIIWALPVDEEITTLLAQLQRAQIDVRTITIRAEDESVTAANIPHGTATNLICGFYPVTPGVTRSRLIREFCILESSVRFFIQACTSLMQAESPDRLALHSAFGLGGSERAEKWRWLGYALSGAQVSPTSIKRVRIEDDSLSVSDVRQFLGMGDPPQHSIEQPPPSLSAHGYKRYVELNETATIFVANAWHSLASLGMGHNTVLAIGNGIDNDTTYALVPGFGYGTIHNADIRVSEMRPSNSPRFNLTALRCGINQCEPNALTLLSQSIGSTLRELDIDLEKSRTLTRRNADAFLSALPLLERLHLHRLSLGSMNVVLTAYESGRCRIAVLSLENSYVDAASMTQFAIRLQDRSSKVFQTLREFSFIFDDKHRSVTAQGIITLEAAAAFADALHNNPWLTFMAIGLKRPVYKAFYDVLRAYDNTPTRALWIRSKLAFSSVFRARSTAGANGTKLRRVDKGVGIELSLNADLMSHVYTFLRPPAGRREVAVIATQDTGSATRSQAHSLLS